MHLVNGWNRNSDLDTCSSHGYEAIRSQASHIGEPRRCMTSRILLQDSNVDADMSINRPPGLVYTASPPSRLLRGLNLA